MATRSICLTTPSMLISVMVILSVTLNVCNSVPLPAPDLKNFDFKLNLELPEIELSPKLKDFYDRLHELHPATMAKGLIQLRKLLAESKSSQAFLDSLIASSSNTEHDSLQVKIYLAELIQLLKNNHPKVLAWLLSTSYGDNHSVTTAQLQFLESFSKFDKEMSKFSEWNVYWNFLFGMISEYIVSHG